MRRRGLLYRRLWYIKKRNLKKINSIVRLLLVLILLCPLLIYSGSLMFSMMFIVTGHHPEFLLRDMAEEYALSALGGLNRDRIMQISSDSGGGDVLVLDRAALLDSIQALEKGLRYELQAAAEEKFPLIKVDYINTSIINDVKGTDRIGNISLKIWINVSAKGTAGILGRQVHVLIPLYETVFFQSEL